MIRSINLAGRTFLLTLMLIGLAVGIAEAAGAICAPPLGVAAAWLTVSVVVAWAAWRLNFESWRALTEAVLESERTGRFMPNFPKNSSLAEVNRQARALNAAAQSVLSSQAALEQAYLEFVETMAQALDARDPYTAGHSLRVAEFSYQLAKAMGLSEAEAQKIRIAAQLHDIGKIGIPDTVLQKPGRLTADEYGLIKLHPQIGRRILEKVGRFEELLSVVELHHENHDGTGYPFGLAGHDVPIEARIVHVADAFDAMTTTRSYRSALSVRAAGWEIEKNSASQFDPVAAHAFLGLLAAGKIDVGGLKVSAQMETGSKVRTRERLAV